MPRQQQLTEQHHYCKCTHGTVVDPDSTGCTTIVTYSQPTGTWSYYCLAQGCVCKDVGPVTWQPSTPCQCK